MQSITRHLLVQQMDCCDHPVLFCQIQYPQFSFPDSKAVEKAINQYCRRHAKERQAYCQSHLFPQACQEYQAARSSGRTFLPYEFQVEYVVTYHQNCLISLYTDQYTFTGDAHGSTKRISCTWDLCTGRKLPLRHFFPYFSSPSSSAIPPADTFLLSCLQNWLEQEIRERRKKDASLYFEDFPQLLRSTFQEDQFFLEPEGIVFYFQPYDIGPHSTGLPTFLLPFFQRAA